MAKVKLLKDWAGHKKDSEIEINDKTVIKALEEKGLIKKSKPDKE